MSDNFTYKEYRSSLVKSSWYRCKHNYGFDRDDKIDAIILSETVLKEHQEASSEICFFAKKIINSVRQIAKDGDYSVLLTDENAVALESYYDFKLSHGKAILYGMKVATHLSNLDKEEKKRIKNIWEIFNLPKLDSINKNEIMIHMENDKKNIGGALNFILLDKLGNAIIKPNFNKKLIEEALDIL